MMKLLAATAAAALCASAASAITLDGQVDAAYGSAKSTVAYNPLAPNSNFDVPTNQSDASAYSIYLTSDADAVYGLLVSDRQTSVPGANLYFDLDPANGNGSDLGFEITNDRAFVPGVDGYAGPLAGLNFFVNADGTRIEFSIANSLFTSAITGLNYEFGANQQFATTGSSVVLRLSQSFGYSVAGGATYGPNRLGAVTIGGNATGPVPEPATWLAMVLGFGLVGGAIRRRAPRFAVA